MNLRSTPEICTNWRSIAAIFSPPRSHWNSTEAQFTGTLSGAISAPRLQGQLNSTNLRLRGSAWKLLRAHLDASPDAFAIQAGELDRARHGAPQGRITFSGNVQLQAVAIHPGAVPYSSRSSPSDSMPHSSRSSSRFTTPVSGTLNAQVQLHGTELNPIGQGHLESSARSVAGEPIQSVVVHFNGDGNATHANANSQLPAGVATACITYDPKQRSYQLQLQAHNFQLDQLQAVKSHNLSIAGAANLDASGRGTLDDPQLTATVTIPQIRAQGKTIDQLRLQANVAQHVATLNLQTHALNSQINGHATVQLTGDYQAEATLDTQPFRCSRCWLPMPPSGSGRNRSDRVARHFARTAQATASASRLTSSFPN